MKRAKENERGKTKQIKIDFLLAKQLQNQQPSTSTSAEIDSCMSSPETQSDTLPSSSSKLQPSFSDESYKTNYEKYIESFHVNQKSVLRHFVKCVPCSKYPEIVKRYCNNTKLPPITTDAGTRYRKMYVVEHFQSAYHSKCIEAQRLAPFNKSSNNENRNLLDVHISNANKQTADHIGKLMLQVYNDAKKLTLSAYSWPSRFVSMEAGNNFDFNDTKKPIVPPTINLQYVSPDGHLDLMNQIVSCSGVLQNRIENAISCSIRIDGSIDRTQIDKIYVMLKTISKNGEKHLNFLGIGKKTKRKAVGLFEAVRTTITENLGETMYRLVMTSISSICTDGCNENRSESKGLWALIEAEMKCLNSQITLYKVWCSAHRMDLVWSDLTDNFKFINNLFNLLSSMASFFRMSAIRSEELKKVASENNATLMSIPKIFEIRWSTWTYVTVINVLKSWNALVIYFKKIQKENCEAAGYFKYLTKIQNLELIVFIADVLHVYQRFHKIVQSDNLTIVKLMKSINILISALEKLKSNRLPGGWEEELHKSILEVDGKMFLKGIEVVEENSRRPLFNLREMRPKIISSAIEYLSERFTVEAELVNLIEPFVYFYNNADVRKVHEVFGSDLSLPSLMLQFDELKSECVGKEPQETIAKLTQSTESLDNFKEIITVLCRIEVCSPQSADVERCIKANNLLKTAQRSKLCLATENKYLYIHINMPPLEDWDPRPVIISWINEKERRNHTNLLDKETKRSYEYFNGVFKDATSKRTDRDKSDNKENENYETKMTDKIVRF